MGKRRRGKTTEVKLYLPEMTFFRLEKILTQNFKSKPTYGVRSQMLTRIIEDWLDVVERKEKETNDSQPESPDHPDRTD